MPIELDERVVEVAGRQVRYRVGGSGPPLVLVHGLGGSTRWWRRNLERLGARFTVHLVDLPGFGGARRAPFVLADAANWLAAWLDALALPRAHVVAHSMGAGIALRLAAARPELVERLVLVAPAGLPTGRSWLAHTPPLARAARRFPPAFAWLVATDVLRARPRTLLRATRDLLGGDVADVLGGVAAPALLVFGRHDTLIPLAHARAYEGGLGDARVVVLDAGHVPMVERPEEFDAVVLEFLTGRR